MQKTYSGDHSGWQFLTDFAYQLAILPDDTDIPRFASTEIRKFTNAKLVSYSDYDSARNSFISVFTETSSEIINLVIKIAGEKILHSVTPIPDEAYKNIQSNLVRYSNSLYEITYGQVTESLDKKLRKLTGLNNLVIITYMASGQIYGGCLLAFNDHQPLPGQDFLIGFTNLVAVALRRKKTLDDLRASEEKFRAAFTISPDFISLTRLSDGIYVDMNEAFLEKAGYKREELVGKTAIETNIWANPDDRNQLTFKLEKHGEAIDQEYQFRMKNGEIFTGLMSARIVELNGQPHLLAFTRDITERKQFELIQKVQYEIATALSISNDLKELFSNVRQALSLLVDTSNFFIALYDSETDMLHVPFEKDDVDTIPESWPAKGSLTGYLLRQKRTLLLTRTQIDQLRESGECNPLGKSSAAWLGSPIISGKRIMGAIVIQSYDNPHIFNQLSVDVIDIVAKQLSAYIDRIEAHASLLRLSKAVIQSPVAIVITDLQGHIDYVNPKFAEITGYEIHEVSGQSISIIESGLHTPEFYKNLWDTILAGNDWKGEILNLRKTGEEFWVNAFISPIFNDQGETINFIAIEEDITDKKRLIENLREAKEKAEESDHLKTAFLNNMSHEIRTPLNGILGFTELLTDPESNNQEREYYKKLIFSSSEQLISIIDDIIQIATIEAGQLTLKEHVTNIEAVIETIYYQHRQKIKPENLSLLYKSLIPKSHQYILVDQTKLSQVISNLMGNAVKFTEKGKVELTCWLEDDKIYFSIADTGIGIPQAFHDIIYERFRQVNVGRTREYGGNGLGLAITKAYIELMGGKISLISAPGEGSTFTFFIPVKLTQSAC